MEITSGRNRATAATASGAVGGFADHLHARILNDMRQELAHYR